MGHEAAIVYVRSLLLWFGLALVSVRLFGNQLGWIIPLASVFPLIWFGPAWWDWTAAHPASLHSWTLAALSLCAGLGTTAASRRRLHVLRSRQIPGS